MEKNHTDVSALDPFFLNHANNSTPPDVTFLRTCIEYIASTLFYSCAVSPTIKTYHLRLGLNVVCIALQLIRTHALYGQSFKILMILLILSAAAIGIGSVSQYSPKYGTNIIHTLIF